MLSILFRILKFVIELSQVVESCRVKMRKPEPRIYEYTLQELGVQPHEAIFLDDIGQNLKAAADMGIRTVKV